MKTTHALTILAAASAALSAPAAGKPRPYSAELTARAKSELPPYLQCVPYAREVSGIGIYGDAYTWWSQAEGRYARGRQPKVGAVLAFKPHGNMRLGHVAAVSKIVDSRRILLRHANWSPINGRRGQVEDDVMAVDVSEANDWSAVRVWYHPLQALGKTAWPVHGFIYSGKPADSHKQQWASASHVRQPAPAPVQPRRDVKPSRQFTAAFSGF
ncbi:CHAP domain-containing protein [Paraurantiacibacter namhicola]|uniref:CHAP domain protein n=1 Tax=Paraurantiacibacter namhicola TaxID=645517 RepID=A0A1C7DB74_9SPHN|nr:CHAP domain-containing protein [Paraurantiacibacter namhicola]ANU08667.1 CHAP domain protein [Paraurantiacibacter namhicola]